MKKVKDTEPVADTSQEPITASSITDKDKLGRGRRIWRSTLIWLVVIATAFLSGVTADHFLRYKPVSENLLQKQSELSRERIHLELLKTLVDVSNARIALSYDDVAGAKAALVDTSQRLENLLPSIAEFDANLAKSMPQRLFLITYGLDRDIETVKIDLELFTHDLQALETAVFND
jgi:hypothetical protein